jgi:hypothetical protein
MKNNRFYLTKVKNIRLLITILFILHIGIYNTYSQDIIKGKAYEIKISHDWEPMTDLPHGFESGFQKRNNNESSTFVFHQETMPPEAGEPPSNTSDMQNQWNVMVRNQYPDAESLTLASPKVIGRILINAAYDLTDSGTKLRRRYTYFLSGRTVFLVQCSAKPSEWQKELSDFDLMIASLVPARSEERTIISDADAVARIKRDIPTLLASFPTQWSCTFVDGSISKNNGKRMVAISIQFYRKDIGEIYNSTKYLFSAIKAGKNESDLQNMPLEFRNKAAECSPFIRYIGQVWGSVWIFVANCDPLIQEFRININSSAGGKIGSVSISREDGSDILSGKVDASMEQKLASMYTFE